MVHLSCELFLAMALDEESLEVFSITLISLVKWLVPRSLGAPEESKR